MDGRIPTRQGAIADSLNHSSRVHGLLQMKHAFEHSPRSRSQEILQRMLNAASGKATIQREATLDDEDLVQAKLEPVQKQDADASREAEEEETLQGRFESAQRQSVTDEDETLQAMLDPVQRRENRTGLPDRLKAGAEGLSGVSLDDVRVHYGSPQPAQLSALAYAQGSDIHVAPGQERHLPHEAWHIVQQKQGRVRPTLQAKGIAINDDVALEREADVMGARALEARAAAPALAQPKPHDTPVQRRLIINGRSYGTMVQVAKKGNDDAWDEFSQLPSAQKQAFRRLLHIWADFQLRDVATFTWIIDNGLADDPLFFGVTPRELTSMEFLVKEAVYANWVHRARAIAFLRSIPNADVSDFAQRYKSYYHLWRRFEATTVNPGPQVENAMLNVEGAALEANVRPERQTGTTGDLQAYIETMAKAGKLRFHSRAAAAGHMIKHGSHLKGGKITGGEGKTWLKQMAGTYIQQANFVVANGVLLQVIGSLGGLIYDYRYKENATTYKTLVEYDTTANAAYILSYFPYEQQNVVMDL